jgi:hypothetical protein
VLDALRLFELAHPATATITRQASGTATLFDISMSSHHAERA